MAASDLVGEWTVKLSDGVHKIQFEHGTTTGKRIIRVDGKVNSFTGILFLFLHLFPSGLPTAII